MSYQKALLSIDKYKEEKQEEAMYLDWIDKMNDYQADWSIWKNLGSAVGGILGFLGGGPAGAVAGITAGSIFGNVGHYATHPSAREELEPFEFGGKFDSGYEREAEQAISEGQISAWDSFNMAMGDVINYVKMGGDFKNPFTKGGDVAVGVDGVETVAGAGKTAGPEASTFGTKLDKMRGNFKVGDTREMYNPNTGSWTTGEFTVDGTWIDPSAGGMPLPEITTWNYQEQMRPQDMKAYTGGELAPAWQTYEAGMPLAPLNKMSMASSPFGEYNPSQAIDYMQMLHKWYASQQDQEENK